MQGCTFTLAVFEPSALQEKEVDVVCGFRGGLGAMPLQMGRVLDVDNVDVERVRVDWATERRNMYHLVTVAMSMHRSVMTH